MIRAGTRDELQPVLAAARAAGRRIALVPTMGALHEGHLSLIDRARRAADFIVMSVFVNPLQFGPGEDYAQYPRDVERDATLAAARGVDLLFAPDRSIMYPYGDPAALIAAPGLGSRLCGAFRPGHFRGVLTVVAKLFHVTGADVAVFGRKDLQQLVMIRAMVRDLDFPVEILDAPIVREADGLALSSRNAYLSTEERPQAARLRQSLERAQAAFSGGEVAAAGLIAHVTAVLSGGNLVRPQYVDVVDATTLSGVERARPGDVIAVAAHVGSTRLIDNHTLT